MPDSVQRRGASIPTSGYAAELRCPTAQPCSEARALTELPSVEVEHESRSRAETVAPKERHRASSALPAYPVYRDPDEETSTGGDRQALGGDSQSPRGSQKVLADASFESREMTRNRPRQKPPCLRERAIPVIRRLTGVGTWTVVRRRRPKPVGFNQ